jgi:hypothetical protein
MQIKPETCAHATLRWGSGGFYLLCADCPQSWVARRAGAAKDVDLDNGRFPTCQTPLAATGGSFEFQPRARRVT